MNAEVDFFNNISYVDEAAKQPLRKVSVSESVGQPNWRRYTNGAVFRILGAVAILSILTGAFYFQHFHDFYFPDSSTYVTPAVSLLSGHGFTDIAGDPETVRTPGYPLFILLFLWMKLDLKYLVILQHVLRELIILATTAITLRVTRSLRQALLAGVFRAFADNDFLPNFAGADVNIGTALYEIFQKAGLAAPTMHMDVVIGKDPDFSQGIYDLLYSLKPQIERFDLNLDALGNFGTLPQRLQEELAASSAVATWLGAVVGAWSRKPLELAR